MNHPQIAKGRRSPGCRLFCAILIIAASTLLLLYPFLSNFLFEHRADSLISAYEAQTEQLKADEREAEWQAAVEYNRALLTRNVQLTDPFRSKLTNSGADGYDNLLNPGGTGILCYIDIPKIAVYLPVYHGTEAETLEKGIGHLKGSSLPVGGANTHCVLSGHTGLNRAKLFTDLTALERGDTFFVHTLGKVLAYEVDQVLVVVPEDVSELMITEGQDYVTLVTCTPYGVNSHRLLVRGKRIPYAPRRESDTESARAGSTPVTSQWMREYEKALVAGLGMVAVLSLAGAAVHRWRCRE